MKTKQFEIVYLDKYGRTIGRTDLYTLRPHRMLAPKCRWNWSEVMKKDPLICGGYFREKVSA